MKINFKIIKKALVSKLMKIEKKLRSEVVNTVPPEYLLTIARLLEVNRERLRRECKAMRQKPLCAS